MRVLHEALRHVQGPSKTTAGDLLLTLCPGHCQEHWAGCYPCNSFLALQKDEGKVELSPGARNKGTQNYVHHPNSAHSRINLPPTFLSLSLSLPLAPSLPLLLSLSFSTVFACFLLGENKKVVAEQVPFASFQPTKYSSQKVIKASLGGSGVLLLPCQQTLSPVLSNMVLGSIKRSGPRWLHTEALSPESPRESRVTPTDSPLGLAWWPACPGPVGLLST